MKQTAQLRLTVGAVAVSLNHHGLAQVGLVSQGPFAADLQLLQALVHPLLVLVHQRILSDQREQS